MPIEPGTRFGPYEIAAPLGAGGMGEVYRAHDTVLDRDVAIKILPDALSGDAERLARFEREARVLAALNHPHIGAIYGIDTSQGVSALVLELVDGETLADRIRRAPLPVPEALRLASQIAEALDAAHRKGIVHRDLKPANIKITTEGHVKVLDFGLAKTRPTRAAALSESPTLTVEGTAVGVVLGTAGYMSPEQARGYPVDARSDIWSFGCVVYEMLTGRQPFGGATVSDTIARVLEREPDWAALPRPTPPAVRELLKRCLEKDVHARVPAIAAARDVIDTARQPGAGRTRRRAVVIGGAAIVVIALAAGSVPWLRSDGRRLADRSEWEQITNLPDGATQPALSPDGRMLAFVRGDGAFATRGEVYVKLLPAGVPTPLTQDGTQKMDPAFSPDGSRLAFTVVDDPSMGSNWDTWLVPVVRGQARPWLANASGLTWVGPNQLLFSTIRRGLHMGIVTSKEDRTEARELYFPANEAGMAHRSALSPDGNWVLVVEMDGQGVFTPCRLVPARGGSAGRLVGPVPSRCTTAVWHPDGRWMYFTADAGDGFHVWRQRLPDGRPEQMTAGGMTQEEGLAIAPDGRSLITSAGQQLRGVWIREKAGERRVSLEGYAFWPQFSADGTKLCYRVTRGPASGQTPSELWVADLGSGQHQRLFPGRLVRQYDLSPDDHVVAAVQEANGESRLWVASLDGRQTPSRMGDFQATSPRFGDTGVFFTAREGGTPHLFRANREGTVYEKLNAQWGGGAVGAVSPDGSWLSLWTRSGTIAVSTRGGPAVPIIQAALARMRWTPDGTRALLAVQHGSASAFGFGRTYVLPLEPGSTLPRLPPGGFRNEEEVAALPGVEVLPYGDLSFSPTPGVYAFSRITVTRNLFRIPLR